MLIDLNFRLVVKRNTFAIEWFSYIKVFTKPFWIVASLVTAAAGLLTYLAVKLNSKEVSILELLGFISSSITNREFSHALPLNNHSIGFRMISLVMLFWGFMVFAWYVQAF